MADPVPLAAVPEPFRSMVGRVARERERFAIVAADGRSVIVISAEELEDLEDALAVARSRLREAGGEVDWIGRGQVKRGLGLDR